MEEWIWTSENK